MITLAPSHQVVFLAADGRHTLDEFVRTMEREYPKPPNGMREQIHAIVQVLVDEQIVRLVWRQLELPGRDN
jgi:hypothetical protein